MGTWLLSLAVKNILIQVSHFQISCTCPLYGSSSALPFPDLIMFVSLVTLHYCPFQTSDCVLLCRSIRITLSRSLIRVLCLVPPLLHPFQTSFLFNFLGYSSLLPFPDLSMRSFPSHQAIPFQISYTCPLFGSCSVLPFPDLIPFVSLAILHYCPFQTSPCVLLCRPIRLILSRSLLRVLCMVPPQFYPFQTSFCSLPWLAFTVALSKPQHVFFFALQSG